MIVLTGGNGFLGRHVRALLRLNEQSVTVVTRQPVPGTLGSNESWVSAAALEAGESDALLRQASAVVHLATASVPTTFANEPWLEISANVDPTFRLIEHVGSVAPAAKFVFVSSGGTIYGALNSATPVDELTPAAPISAYGLGKAMIEEGLRYTGRTRGLEFAILRVANPVGIHARQGAQGLVPAAIRALQTMKPLELFGDGGTIRDYLCADDVAEAIVMTVRDRRFTDRTWNVGAGFGISNLEMLERVSRIAGRPVPYHHVPARGIDVPAIVLNCRKIADELGWTARRDLNATIAQMWRAQADPIAQNLAVNTTNPAKG